MISFWSASINILDRKCEKYFIFEGKIEKAVEI
jgi:hypothetical protein